MHHDDMATKTITITLDQDAYEILASCRQQGQSWSQVVRERLGKGSPFALFRERPEVIPRIATTSDLRRALKKISVSDETLDEMESIVRSRAESPVEL